MTAAGVSFGHPQMYPPMIALIQVDFEGKKKASMLEIDELAKGEATINILENVGSDR